MLLLEANQLLKYYEERLIFKCNTLKIYKKDRIGIVGLNGSGKTTLMDILAGTKEPDEGIVRRYGRYAYIQQFEIHEDTYIPSEMNKIFSISHPDVTTMSGGEKTRLKIAQALGSDSHILFADEPTSNLDMKGIQMLEDMLKNYKGAMVIISHDRQLLDALCNKILEIEEGKVLEYQGNYSSYQAQKKEKLARIQFEYEQYVSEKKRLTEAIQEKKEAAKTMRSTPSRMGNSEARLHKRSVNSKRAKLEKASLSIESRLEKLEKKEKPKKIPKAQMDILDHQQLHRKVVISGEGIEKAFGDKVLFKNLSFQIPNQAKVALVGDNGTGKTTLLRMIINGDKAIESAKGTKVGYHSQNLEILDEDKTILENVMETSIQSMSFCRTILARLLFKRDDVYKKVSILSGGEKVKAAFAKIFVSDINMIIMDEPTNYLDIYSMEALEEVLAEYQGTLLFVSHDRRFIDRIANRIILLEDQRAIQFEGNFTGYFDHIKEKSASTPQNIKEELMRLENCLSEVLGRLSMPGKNDDPAALDAEYKSLLGKIKGLKQNQKIYEGKHKEIDILKSITKRTY